MLVYLPDLQEEFPVEDLRHLPDQLQRLPIIVTLPHLKKTPIHLYPLVHLLRSADLLLADHPSPLMYLHLQLDALLFHFRLVVLPFRLQ